jgi:ABC transporter with metal-binding/Fe-S-binding domain ATP-binding protein
MFSGGKDSTLALHRAAEKEEVTCLITVISKNPESFMFHTPNVAWTQIQARALELPLVSEESEGKKEEELADLKRAIWNAKHKFGIEGVVTGAVESVYQAQRVQRICHDLDLWCLNPMWKMNQRMLLEELLQRHFKVLISGIFAYPLDETWLGKEIDNEIIGKLVKLQGEYGISPSGEGGEIETTVLDSPMFKWQIEVLEQSVQASGNSGVLQIKRARLVPK